MNEMNEQQYRAHETARKQAEKAIVTNAWDKMSRHPKFEEMLQASMQFLRFEVDLSRDSAVTARAVFLISGADDQPTEVTVAFEFPTVVQTGA